ncbi:MAG: isochorismate synthase [Acidimicrobiales bacterium]
MAVTTPSGGLRSVTERLDRTVDLVGLLGHTCRAWIHDGAGLVGIGEAAVLDVSLGQADDAVARLLSGVEVEDPLGFAGAGPVVFGAFDFEAGVTSRLTLPSQIVGTNRQGQSWLTTIGEVRPDSPPLSGFAPEAAGTFTVASTYTVASLTSEAQWTRMVSEALNLIEGGALEKVVLARQVELWSPEPFDLGRITANLAAAHPSCFVYAGDGFVGASPELLVRRRGPLVTSRPMAGTARRADTAAADRAALEEMAGSAKQRREHALVVAAVVEALRNWCGEVSASDRPEVARLSTLAHLATTVAGRLHGLPTPTAVAVAHLLHPTPAVAGWPTTPAVDVIGRLESFDRARYSGPVGWMDYRGDGDWAVAVRCAQVEANRARLSAGAGIVAGSDPAEEWRETRSKFDPMLRALIDV